MAKLWIFSSIALGIALILSLLVAISVPTLPDFDVSRVTLYDNDTLAPLPDPGILIKAYHVSVTVLPKGLFD